MTASNDDVSEVPGGDRTPEVVAERSQSNNDKVSGANHAGAVSIADAEPVALDLSIIPEASSLIEDALRYGLERLIVVNSYVKKKARAVDLRRSTHIAGRNGKGKTSLLRLIPLFFGESPSRMVRPNGNVLQSLREYVFDSPSSYLVFEYRNFDGLKLAIMFYGTKEAPSYMFCDGPYDNRLFTENNHFVESRVLNGRLKTFKRNPTHALGVGDYQNIIQRCHQKLASDLRPFLNRFALAREGSLAGIEKVASGMFFKGTTFAALKRMAYSVMTETSEDAAGPVLTTGSKMHLFFSNFRSYHAVMRHAQEFIDGSNAHLALKKAQQMRIQTGIQANLLCDYVGTQVSNLTKNLGSANERLNNEKNAHAQSLREIDALIDKVSSTIDQANKLAKAIENERLGFERQDIHVKRQLVEGIPNIEARINESRIMLDALQRSSGDINHKYDQQLHQVRQQSHLRVQPLQDRRAAISQEVTEKQQELASELGKASADLRHQLDQAEERIAEKLQAANDKVAELKAIAASTTISEEFQHKLDSLASRKAALADEYDALRTTIQTLGGDLNWVMQSHQQTELRLQQEERFLLQKKLDLDHKMRLHSPAPDTLLYFLRQNMPFWYGNIGKVVKDEVLLNTDLKPNLLEDENPSLYGVDLDLVKMNSTVAAREQLLAEDIQNLQDDVRTSAAKAEALRDDLTKAAADRDAANKRKGEAEASAVLKKNALDEVGAQIASTQRAAQEDLKKRKQERDALVLVAEDEKQRIKARQSDARDQRKSRIQALEESFVARGKEIEQWLARELTLIAARIHDEERQRDATIKTLEDSRSAELREGGVDVSALSKLDEQIREEGERLTAAISARELVEKYERWAALRPNERAEALELVRVNSASLAEHEARRKDTVQKFIDYTALIERSIFKDTIDLRRFEDDLEQINKFRYEHNTEPLGTSLRELFEPVGATIENLASAYGRYVKEVRSARAQRNDAIKKIHAGFIGVPPDTHVGQFAQTLPISVVDTENESNFDEVISLLSEWYAAGHEQSRDFIAFECKQVCNQLLMFHHSLTGYREKIISLSRQLQRSLTQDMVFDAIRSVSLSLNSKVERLPYWNELSGVVYEYRRWQELNDCSGMPPQELHFQLEGLNHKIAGGKVQETPETLIDMEVKVDDGTVKVVTNENELTNVSSTGLSQMVMATIFIAFVNRVRRDPNVWLTWAIDEVGTIDSGNALALMDLLQRNRITLVSAEPEGEATGLSLFENHYEILQGFELQRAKPTVIRSHRVRKHQGN